MMTKDADLGQWFQDYGSMVVSGCALLFTVGTFWWNNWRRGVLKSDPPRAYTFIDKADSQIITLPVAIRNTGARAIPVVALRLLSPDGCVFEHDTVRARLKLDPADDEKSDFTSNFVVPGRGVDHGFRQFRSAGDWNLAASVHDFRLYALQGDKRRWECIGKFPLEFRQEHLGQMRTHFITYSNDKVLDRKAPLLDPLRKALRS